MSLGIFSNMNLSMRFPRDGTPQIQSSNSSPGTFPLLMLPELFCRLLWGNHSGQFEQPPDEGSWGVVREKRAPESQGQRNKAKCFCPSKVHPIKSFASLRRSAVTLCKRIILWSAILGFAEGVQPWGGCWLGYSSVWSLVGVSISYG